MKELLVGKKSCNDGIGTRNPRISYYTGEGGVVECQIPAQTRGDKANFIDGVLKTVRERISQMPTDRLSNTIDLIVREVVGRAVVGARTGADKKILIIQEINNAIRQVENVSGQEQDEKMQKFYQDLISALQDKQESVYDSLNPEQIVKLKAAQNTK